MRSTPPRKSRAGADKAPGAGLNKSHRAALTRHNTRQAEAQVEEHDGEAPPARRITLPRLAFLERKKIAGEMI